MSDVVCPWCIVGYRQLQTALQNADLTADIHWHPFELNPQMPAEGQNLREHIMEKYGQTRADSDQNRQHLRAVGQTLGIAFNFTDESRIYNTYDAHQLMHWADTQGKKHDLKLALMHAYFTEQLDIANRERLVEIASQQGLDSNKAADVLNHQRYADAVRQEEQLWTSRGIQGVPAVILNNKYLLSGAQGVDNFQAALVQVNQEMQTETKVPG